jgi:hypothetical protein
MSQRKQIIASLLAVSLMMPVSFFAANHREAPITALDRLADITDWFSFVSYEDPSKVVFIMNIDPLLDPANGPNYFPFDPEILYEMHIDNNKDGVPDVTFQFRFTTELRLPGVFTAFVGAGNGVNSPSSSPAPVPAGTPIIPPAITALDGAGSQGLGIRQCYTVTMLKGRNSVNLTNLSGGPLFAVPTNVGPRTMPCYAPGAAGCQGGQDPLAKQGIYLLTEGVRVFAGTVDDPFYIDLGGAFDSLNLRTFNNGTGVPGVLTEAQFADDKNNFAADNVAGYNVNTIAIEVPITLLTRAGDRPPATSPDAVIGSYASTSRPRVTVRRSPDPLQTSGGFHQVQRMGNALINELIIGTGSKDKFSMSFPTHDSDYANFFLDPLLPRALNAVYGNALPVPDAPRTDLLPLVVYAPPIAPAGTPAGPIADLLRLNTGVPPTPLTSRKRMGLLGGDPAGYPNGRRVSDDVTDISLQAVIGLLTGKPQFTGFPHKQVGDGANTNDVAYQEVFPYVAFAQDGRNSVHQNPGQDGFPLN